MDAKTALLVKIAYLYYEQEKTQNEIAEICQIERSRVSRLLLEARNLGIVQFHVVDPTKLDQDSSHDLQRRFGLQEAIVFSTLEVPDTNLKRAIGLVAADYIRSNLKEGDIFAVSWGDTIYYTVQNFSSERQMNAIVVPAIGGSGLISPAYQVNNLVQRIAEQIGAIHKTLYAPAFVESKEVRDALLESKDIKPIVDIWKDATVVLVGIGKSPYEYGRKTGNDLQFGQFYLRRNESQELKQMGVVGDVNARFFDAKGLELQASIHDRTIGMSLKDLQRVPKVIAVAGGLSKIAAIRGALVGGHIDVLITDDMTARQLLSDKEQ